MIGYLINRVGGNNLKQNYTAIKYGNDHGSIAFGKIHKKADVTSDIMLAASDGEHFMSMDKDGQRTGWTTIMSPGNFQVECGSNREKQMIPAQSTPRMVILTLLLGMVK